MVASYPLSSQAPTPVEVELGCDNNPRVDTGDDDRISKEEFTSDGLKSAMEKVI